MPRRDQGASTHAAASVRRLAASLGSGASQGFETQAAGRNDYPVSGPGGLAAPDLPAEAGLLGDVAGEAGEKRARHARLEPAGERVRWSTRPRVIAFLVLPVLMLAGWFAWQGIARQSSATPLSSGDVHQVARPSADTAEGRTGPEGSGQGAPPASDHETSRGRIVVHVAGAVGKPGVVTLPDGSRVFQAIDAAGGPTLDADANQLNLAGTVRDGDKVHVPRQGESLSASAGPGASAAKSGSASPSSAPASPAGGKVNINQATVEELATLPRVGPVLAGKIVAFRSEHGPFASVDELDAVDGIGPKMLESLLPFVTV